MIFTRIKLLFLVSCFLTILVGLVFLTYLRFVDGEIINIPIMFSSNIDQIPVEKAIYKPGETVMGKISFCKNRDIIAHIQWQLVNSYLTIFDDRVSSLHNGCHYDLMFAIETIPVNAIDGKYHLEGSVSYRVNALNTITYYLKTQEFQVKKSGK